MSDFALKSLRGDYAITEDESRVGSLFHYHLPDGREIVVYPLLFGEARLCTGRIDSDSWQRGFDYPSARDAIDAAYAWTRPEEDPPGNFIRKHYRTGAP